MAGYDEDFYDTLHAHTKRSAEVVLSKIWEFVQPKTVLDVGCGVGTWLFVAKALGAEKVYGLDGEWVPRDKLLLGQGEFLACNLETLPPPSARYDLAISLEVAEHLSPSSGTALIHWLCHSSDLVLFSAAVPGQGGRVHVNEQWQSYWAAIFMKQGYKCIDVIRSAIWDDSAVPFWYKQNSFLYVRAGSESEKAFSAVTQRVPADVVHPALWERGAAGGGRKALAELVRALRSRVWSFAPRT